MRRDTLHILFGIGGRHGFAAVGAMQTIGVSPRVLIRLDSELIQPTERLILQSCQKALDTSFVVTDHLPEAM
jgi:hypothetical protein